MSQYRYEVVPLRGGVLEQISLLNLLVIALQYFHRLIDRLQAAGAAASIRVVLADELAIAIFDAA